MTNLNNKFASLTEGTRNWVAAEAGRFLDAFARQDWAAADVAYVNVTTYIPLGGCQPETELAWEFLTAIAA